MHRYTDQMKKRQENERKAAESLTVQGKAKVDEKIEVDRIKTKPKQSKKLA